MIGVEELGRRAYAEMTNDHGVEGALRESLKAREPVFDEFDRFGYAVAFVLAWANVKADAPGSTEDELADAAASAAELSLRALNTRGGWDAMVAGASSDESTTVLEWLNSIPTAPEVTA